MLKTEGIAIKGKGQGRKNDFPTANLKSKKKIGSGVYTGIARVGKEKFKAAICARHSKDEQESLIEIHIINFSGNLYGQKIEVAFIKKIREVRRFRNRQELRKQIAKDVNIVKNYFEIKNV